MTAEDLKLIRAQAEFRRIWSPPDSHAGKDAAAVLRLLDTYNELRHRAENLLIVLNAFMESIDVGQP